jgi:hypothetical protein
MPNLGTTKKCSQKPCRSRTSAHELELLLHFNRITGDNIHDGATVDAGQGGKECIVRGMDSRPSPCTEWNHARPIEEIQAPTVRSLADRANDMTSQVL